MLTYINLLYKLYNNLNFIDSKIYYVIERLITCKFISRLPTQLVLPQYVPAQL